MLKGIDPLLSADLLWILAAMGHGDDLAIVDGNHPAEAIGRSTTSGRLVRLPGITMERAVAAILTGKAGRLDSPVAAVISGRNVALPTIRRILAA